MHQLKEGFVLSSYRHDFLFVNMRMSFTHVTNVPIFSAPLLEFFFNRSTKNTCIRKKNACSTKKNLKVNFEKDFALQQKRILN